MKKKAIIILVIVVLLALAYYGYTKGWFGNKTSRTITTPTGERIKCGPNQIVYFDGGSGTYGCRTPAST